MQPLIIEHISKSFGNLKVLSDICLQQNQGEILGLLGPSGAGKSTLLNIISGQILPDNGKVLLFNNTVGKKSKINVYKKISFMFDQLALWENLTVFENLKFYSDVYKSNSSEINNILKKIGLKEYATKRVCSLSKGMKQRLALGRALLKKADLYFFDEPTSALDPNTAHDIHSIITDLRKSGASVFMTTHNMKEATILCDNVALLNDGMIIEYGTPSQICRKYSKDIGIRIEYANGKTETVRKEEYSRIKNDLNFNNIVSIHSTEPTLEDVFISLTGKRCDR